MNSLVINIPVADKYTNALKKIEHESFTIERNLEMIHKVAVVFYENVQGAFGRPMLQLIQEEYDQNLITKSVYQQSIERFKTVYYTSATSGSFVNPSTGESILPGINGFDPEVPKVTEIEYWQAAPIALFTTNDGKLSTPVYNALLYSMGKMIERNRI